MIEVRKAGRHDAGTAGRLLAAQLEEHTLPVDAAGIERALDLCLEPGAKVELLLAFDGEAVGVCLANPIVSAEHGGTAIWIEELYVAPGARRRGVARALLDALLRSARASGARAVELEVAPGHEAARALYRSVGFRENERTPYVLDLLGA
jgi:ribosomal protein S18 acetylase RimI-like enzyme